MFLSLVVDPLNCKALSGNMFDQRFNVAASRAQDRMYLVRSVQLSELSDKDLRTGLLTHFDNPLVVDKVEAEVLIDRCESGFEKQVYSELVSRGYRVTPQVKTGAYRIDMVVEGQGDLRLAIECDGDEFHGPDRWQHDLSRQRVLERAGWVFWRCFASTWVLRKDEVMEELVQFLYRMGIEPLGAIETAARIVEKRVVNPDSDASRTQEEQSLEVQSFDASSEGSGPVLHEVTERNSAMASTRPDEMKSAVPSGANGNASERWTREITEQQPLRKGDSVTYRTNKGKRRTGVITWTDGKQIKLIDNGATVSKNVDDILSISGLESNLLH
jgi:very-short-patch-repair endonuclease